MSARHDKPNKQSNRMGFVLFPVLFFLLGTSLLGAVAAPYIRMAGNLLDMVLLSEPPSFSEKELSIFDPSGSALATNGLIHMDPSQVPTQGVRFGQLTIESAGIDAPLYYGDDVKTLKKGVGCYSGSYFPGMRRTTLIAGHCNTFFHTLDAAKVGDTVRIRTNYGDYVYKVSGFRIAAATDTTAYDLKKNEENLVLYTCYPLNYLGLTSKRYFLYATFQSGPELDLAY